MDGDNAFAEVRAIYQSDDRLRVPPVVFSLAGAVAAPAIGGRP
ncbi:MAG: hypothetical protein WCE23_08380 [Candidatus Binatus sp.]